MPTKSVGLNLEMRFKNTYGATCEVMVGITGGNDSYVSRLFGLNMRLPF